VHPAPKSLCRLVDQRLALQNIALPACGGAQQLKSQKACEYLSLPVSRKEEDTCVI
jgi:hypothetical protein